MTLQTSGPIKFSELQTEFGGSNPISLSEYYAGGANVPLTNIKTQEWASYRQALRDITDQADPFNIAWPEEPK